MARTHPSMQELIGRRRRAGFVGRGGERAAFRENLDLAPEDERHRFRFHVHGNAGVGKTFLLREWEQIARERGALTAYVDEGADSVPEAMAAISRERARQGGEFKRLDRALASYRERRHEAEAVAAALDSVADGPSPATATAVRAGLAGLGLIPGAGPFVGAVDPDLVGRYADRLRRGLSARFGNQDDVQLVLSPERALTPRLLDELAEAAAGVRWIVLFFDTYERTGPFLDGWLHDLMTTDRYGALPANVVLVTAGQHPLDRTRWGGFTDFTAEVPLGPFTEAETRGLLAARGVVDEPVVAEVLRLTGGLPLLVSTLAAQRPTGLDDIGDPGATAVERFLKWEPEPARRAVALACALPRGLDMDVFRAAVDTTDGPDGAGGPGSPGSLGSPGSAEETEALFAWLRGLPFVDDRGDRLRYHDLVRETMLRLQRRRSPQRWRERHERLAAVHGRWCEEAADGMRPEAAREQKRWRELRLERAYHLLCARPRTELPGALRGAVEACRWGRADGRRWARMLEEAGGAADDEELRRWGQGLRDALVDDRQGVTRAVDLLLSRPGLDLSGQALAYGLRGRELLKGDDARRALAAFDQAVASGERAALPDTDLSRLHRGRGLTHRALADLPSALADLDRADALAPGSTKVLADRAETSRLAGRHEAADSDFGRVLILDPGSVSAFASRAVCRHALGRLDEALADFDRALDLDADHLWARIRRARLHRDRGEWDEAFRDLDEAVARAPDLAWPASERGDSYRRAERYEEAVAELGRAIALQPGYASALASRGATLCALGRYEEALADLDHAVALGPGFVWALVHRARCKRRSGDEEGAIADLRLAAEAAPDDVGPHAELGRALWRSGRHREALPVLRRVTELDAEDPSAPALLGAVHRELEDHPEAFRCLDRAVALDPGHGWALAQRALAALETGRTERALADLDRCLALAADGGGVHGPDAEPVWPVLAACAAALTGLMTAPGADRAGLAPRLAAVEAARDADRARYAS
ncbi:tetratricopeptide repeat protein [Streptomyces sp. NPDC090108]|uniref:tetratricopeptide repeat protein n=1 Tax=Streptomyces sp. NPDC090108 TaxID=3365947 RepID=UPI003826458C